MGRRMGPWITQKRLDAILGAAFDAAGLPEVAKDKLLPGQYTNKRIVRVLQTDRHTLLRLLFNLPRDPDPSVRRSALSQAVKDYKKSLKSR